MRFIYGETWVKTVFLISIILLLSSFCLALLGGCKTIDHGYVPEAISTANPDRIAMTEAGLGDYLRRLQEGQGNDEEILCFLATGAMAVREYSRSADERSLEDRVEGAIIQGNWYATKNFIRLLNGKAYHTFLLGRLEVRPSEGELWLAIINYFANNSATLLPLLQIYAPPLPDSHVPHN